MTESMEDKAPRMIVRLRREHPDGTAEVEEREILDCSREELGKILRSSWTDGGDRTPASARRLDRFAETVAERLKDLRIIVDQTEIEAVAGGRPTRRCTIRLADQPQTTAITRPGGGASEGPAGTGGTSRPRAEGRMTVSPARPGRSATNEASKGPTAEAASHTGLMIWDESLTLALNVELTIHLHFPDENGALAIEGQRDEP